MKIDLLIPCFNEDRNITTLISEWKKITEENKNIFVLFIDNGSTDKTNHLLKNNIDLKNSKNLQYLIIDINKGYGYGLKKGFQNSFNDKVAWTHADLQIPSDDVRAAIDYFLKFDESSNVLLKGKRYNRNYFDLFFTFFMALIGYFFTKELIYDINAQPKIFNRKIIDDIKDYPDDFLIDAHLLYNAQKNGIKIIQFKSLFKKRKFNSAKGGGSFYGKLKLSIMTLKYYWYIKSAN